MRILLAALTAFVISTVVGWLLIPVLRALHAGQAIKEIGPNWHKNKEGTPTMGGIMFIVAVVAAVVVFGWRDMAAGSWQALFVLAFSLVCGAIGFVDAVAKSGQHENPGLPAGWQFRLRRAG
ncbi:MAG: phospho-N-acetylmuramoyl-pentapeptide-transferase, partial [Oscillospiraceae bacterium]|nr:phospho-N-acetylmuramoyl-pentapeptide-transferase [Oscillospiraceae bacterium]